MNPTFPMQVLGGKLEMDDGGWGSEMGVDPAFDPSVHV